MDVDVNLNASTSASVFITAASSVWRTYTPTDSDLLKIPFTVSNPGLRLPTSVNNEEELSFFQLFFTDDVISEFVQETNRYAHEKIQKSLPLKKRSI